jgi:hypothetical protein
LKHEIYFENFLAREKEDEEKVTKAEKNEFSLGHFAFLLNSTLLGGVNELSHG